MGIRPKLRAAGTIILLAGCALLAACQLVAGRSDLGHRVGSYVQLPEDLSSLSCEDLKRLYHSLGDQAYDAEYDSEFNALMDSQDDVRAALVKKCGEPPLLLADLLDGSHIRAGGYVDASYIAGFNKGKDIAYREFDGNNNTFMLNQAVLQLAYLPKDGFGAKATLLAGEDAKVVNRIFDGNFYSYGSTGSSSSSTFALVEGYAQYRYGKLSVQGGRLLANDSYESIYAPANDNISRGFAFTWSPQLLTGGRVGYDVCPHYNLFGGVYNSSYGYSEDNNKQKAFELGGTLSGYGGNIPSVTWTDFYSVEGSGSDQFRTNYFGAYMNFKPPGPLKVGAVVDWTRGWGMTQSTTIFGGGAYADYKLTPKLDLAGRAEYFSTRNALGNCNKPDGKCDIGELTATLGYRPAVDFKLQFEFRYDTGTGAPLFPNGFGPGGYGGSGPQYKSTQTELGLQASYRFGYFPRY